MKLMRSHPEHLDDFNAWITDHTDALSRHIVDAATSWEEVLGMRYALGEYEALRAFINAPLVEAAQLTELETQEDG